MGSLLHTFFVVVALNLSLNYASNFSEKYFGVLFDPSVSERDVHSNSYNDGELAPMIAKISSEFRHVFMREIYNATRSGSGHDITEIPKAIALFNTQIRSDQQPIRLTMPFYTDSFDNGAERGSFDFVKMLADKANSIFPGTVQTLLLRDFELDSETLNTTIAFLRNVHAKLNNNNNNNNSSVKFNYDLGVFLLFEDCGKSTADLQPYLAPLFPLVQLVMFEKFPRVMAFRHGTNTAIRKLTSTLENCKLKIRSVSPATDVGFVSSWTEDPKDLFREPSDLPYFWREMNEWAVRTRTTVILHTAFDSFHVKSSLNSKTGWWRLIESIDYLTSRDYVFEAKEEAARKAQSFNQNVGVLFDPAVSTGDKFAGDFYSIDELIFMIKFISNKFGTLAMHPIPFDLANDTGTDMLEIPKAVALFNKNNRSAGQPPIQLIIQFSWEASEPKEHQWSLEAAKRLADEANFIFPGSVQSLIFRPLYLIDASRDVVLYAKTRLSSPENNFHYKLGVVFAMGICHTKIQFSAISPIFPLVDLVMFDGYPTILEYALGAEEFSWRLIRLGFQDCQRRIGKYYPDLEVGFTATWPDTWNETYGQQNLSSEVHVWKSINTWAGRSNSSVIFRVAFDTPNQEHPIRTVGWWRLVEENVTYRSATDYVFEDKEELVYSNTRSIAPFLTPPINVGHNFSRETTGVWFNQMGSKINYSREELVIMISRISSKFSIITMPTISTQLPDFDVLDIPSAVAHFNRDHKPPDQPAIQLVMHFALDGPWHTNGNYFQTGSFYRVKQLADAANQIHFGTVRILVLEIQEIDKNDDESLNTLVEHLKHVGNVPTFSSLIKHASYEIGITFEFSDCLTSMPFIEALLTKSPLVTYVMFHAFPSPKTHQEEGPRKFVQELCQALEKCKSQVAAVSPATSVGFSTGWPDRWNESSEQNLSSLVYFWTEMDKWALNTSSNIMFFEAFDNPTKSSPFNKFGWWRPVKNESYRHAGHYKFEAKEDVVLLEEHQRKLVLGTERNGSFDQADQSDKVSGFDGLAVTLSIAGAALVVLAITGATVFFVYRRVIRGQAHRSKLTRAEVRGFFDGMTSTFVNHSATSGIVDGAYDTSLEIPVGSFEIDEECVLGSGAFGVVFRGKIFIRSMECQVAVKTTKPSCPASALRGLLSEIKVMSHVGKHNNILGIAGAHTEQISNGKVYVFTEFCSLGSLEKFLRRIDRSTVKATFIKSTTEGVSDVSADEGTVVTISQTEINSIISDLQKWSYEITCGMEYLASKHVVHADVATRNVLLTEHKNAKISDFGLSRRLYNYEDYVKSQKEPMPWRWMSPESLGRMVFNEKTDVWSYGITLWEIFSLGDLPYPGMSWNADWSSQLLDNGLRLPKPKYDMRERHAIMMKCWEADPETRPSFSDLKTLWDETEYAEVY